MRSLIRKPAGILRLTANEFKAMADKPDAKPTKFHNKRVFFAGHCFDSKREAKRWGELLLEERAGTVADLRRQVTYPLIVNGVEVSRYTADFVYRRGADLVVEDVKSRATMEDRAWALRVKLLFAIHGLKVTITK